MAERQVKSRERVADHSEVFTAQCEMNSMLNSMPQIKKGTILDMTKNYTVTKHSIFQDVVFYIVIGIITFVFLAIFSYYTSPFTTCDNGADAAFFRLVGQGMTQGYLPYRDFFDMKGPFLFFIQYIGQLLSYGRLGLFIIQWINLFCSIVIICKIFELYHISNRIIQICLLIPIAFIASFTFEGGNLTEEFSLIELCSCLFLCLYYFKSNEIPNILCHTRFYCYAGLWYGICFGLLLMIRITNAALICAMLLIISLDLIKAKKYRELGVCACMYIIGLTTSVIPAILFFGLKGLIGEAFEAVFVLGFKYAGEKTLLQHILESFSSYRLILLIVIPCLIPIIFHWRSWRERFFMIIGTLFTFLAISSGNNYPHYYTLTIPLVLVSEISIAETLIGSNKRKRLLAIVLSGMMLLPLLRPVGSSLYSAYKHLFQQNQYKTEYLVRDVSSKIPEEDKNSVFCYNLNPSWYTYADLFPCIKYCGWQNHYITLMPEIYDDLHACFQSHPPTWLVLPKEKGNLPDFLDKMLYIDYGKYYENESYTLYYYSHNLP